ncbi:hypothetical protein [Microcoleus sp. CAWBG58]|uniref:hypothetical protein n=1 Tax=Microcoleus sp. CAWBG58 TaxID=2841651 RepID=UPI0025FD510A|nr:hypothetical protein [Microcoleus sp. CAWBG58]
MILHLGIPSSSAEADIVCVDAVSNRRGFFYNPQMWTKTTLSTVNCQLSTV